MRLRHAQLPFAHLWLPASCGEHFLYKTGFLSVVRIIMLRLFNYMAHVCSSAPPGLPLYMYVRQHAPGRGVAGARAALCWLCCLWPRASLCCPPRRSTCSGRQPGGQLGPLRGCAGPEGSAGRKMGEEAANIRLPAKLHLLPRCYHSEYRAGF